MHVCEHVDRYLPPTGPAIADVCDALTAAGARSWLRADRGPIPAVILFAPFLSVVPGRRGRRTPVRAIGPARAGPDVSALRQNRQIWRDATDHANKPTGEQNGGSARAFSDFLHYSA